jgi:hypothetical protein
MTNVIKVLGENEYEASPIVITKSDEEAYDSIEVKEKGQKSGYINSFRIKPFYTDYCAGKPLGEIMLQIINLMEESIGRKWDFDLESITSFDKGEKLRIIRPISYNRNKQTLTAHVYRRVGDIALVLYLIVSEEKGQMATAKIPKSSVDGWGLDVDFVINLAMENTMKRYPPIMVPLECAMYGEEYIKNMPAKKKFFMNSLIPYQLEQSKINTYYLSIDNGVNGAIAAFYSGVLTRISDMFKDDLYLTFTSVRECLLHPVSMVSKKSVQSAAMGNISGVTNPADFLSTSVYIYTSADKKLEMIR